ncbi:MAG: apolipoprotein N-acyltransferase [Cellvibrionaceae bacterium]
MNKTTSVWSHPVFWIPVAALSCAILSAISALYPEFYLLGWIAFVPFLIGLQQCRSVWQAYWFGLLTGLLAFGLSTYWMAEFIRLFRAYSFIHSVGLASIYWFYCAQIFALVASLTHYLTQNLNPTGRNNNAILWAFPTVLALVFAFYPTLFPWQIGNAQSEFLVALQATDITGVSGLDFIVGIVNVFIAQALIGRAVFFQRSALAAYALIVSWFIYGVLSLHYWDSKMASWDTLKIGLVQTNEPPTIGTPDPRPGYSLSYPIEMDLTEQLVAAGAELVIWPELRNKQYYTEAFVKDAYQKQVAKLESSLLFQSFEQEKNVDRMRNFNTSTFLDETGKPMGKYQKIKRIPMAEYLPLFENSDSINRWTRYYLGEFFGRYSAGSAPTIFNVGNASIKPFICFEIIFPRFVAASTDVTGGDIFTVQSNNGWFGNTRVPYQHMSASVLRSVENRRPLVHVMNNGLGGVLAPNGRSLLQTDHQEIAGYLLDVPFQASEKGKTSTTFYSRFPYWFVSFLGLILMLMLMRTRRSY